MYITCAVQVCSVYSDKAWYLFLSVLCSHVPSHQRSACSVHKLIPYTAQIPAYLIYKFGGMLLSFLGSGSGGGGAVPDAGASNDGDEDVRRKLSHPSALNTMCSFSMSATVLHSLT